MFKNKILIAITALLVLLLSATVAYSWMHLYRHYAKNKQLQDRRQEWLALEQRIKHEADLFGQDSGILIKDLSHGWVIAINENKLFPSASLVKVPIMASFFAISAEKKLDLKQCLILKNRYKALGSGILKCYASGSEFNLQDLIELMVEDSDNTAANMLIDYLGFDTLNAYFKKLGLNNTNIVRKMMDFKSRKEGYENFTSAADMAFLLEKIYDEQLVNKDSSFKCMEILKKQKLRDRIPAKLPVNTLVAHKTGLERGICHDVGIVFTPYGNFIICALVKHNYRFARPAKRFIARIALDTYNFYLSEGS